MSIMAKICAPVRDDKIEELKTYTDVIETFKGIMETLQLMKLDLANFTINMIRPNIVASSIEYEKTKFAEFLKIQADGLQYTRKWLLKHMDETKMSTSNADQNSFKQITHCLLAEAYLDLLEFDFTPKAEVGSTVTFFWLMNSNDLFCIDVMQLISYIFHSSKYLLRYFFGQLLIDCK